MKLKVASGHVSGDMDKGARPFFALVLRCFCGHDAIRYSMEKPVIRYYSNFAVTEKDTTQHP